MSTWVMSLLHRPADHPAHQRALRQQEHDRDRDDCEQRGERQFRPEDVHLLTAAARGRVERRGRREQVGQADLDRVLGRVREDGVGEEEVVPVSYEAEEEHEGDDGLRERKRDAAERLPFAGTVHARRVEQVAWDRGRVVKVREVYPEREKRERQDDREHAPDQVQRVELEEDREHERRRGHDHHHERERQHEPAAGKLPEREAVASRDRRRQHDRRRAERVKQRVADPGAVDVIAEGVEVVPRQRDLAEAAERERAARDERAVGLRRGEDQPDDGYHEEDGERREDYHPQAACGDPHQSALRNSPVRGTIRTAATRPIMSRSTAMAAAALKSPYRKASWYASWFDDQVSGTRPRLASFTSCGSMKSCVPVANDRIVM